MNNTFVIHCEHEPKFTKLFSDILEEFIAWCDEYGGFEFDSEDNSNEASFNGYRLTYIPLSKKHIIFRNMYLSGLNVIRVSDNKIEIEFRSKVPHEKEDAIGETSCEYLEAWGCKKRTANQVVHKLFKMLNKFEYLLLTCNITPKFDINSRDVSEFQSFLHGNGIVTELEELANA